MNDVTVLKQIILMLLNDIEDEHWGMWEAEAERIKERFGVDVDDLLKADELDYDELVVGTEKVAPSKDLKTFLKDLGVEICM